MLLAGQACLIVALACAVYGAGASLYGARTRKRQFVASGRRAVYAMAGATTVAFVILELAFVNSDFEFAVVASHSSTTTPLFYRLTAMWSSQEGSLLLWLFLLGAWASLILYLTRHRLRVLAPYAQAVLLGFGTFFAAILVLAESPFAKTPNPVMEGAGLNPLLRDPGMMIHPPMLYSGYTLFAIPFAFAVAALVTRRLDAEWIRSTRPFTLAAWVALGFGIVLGARWSYHELDWGGYWMWDPVENASLMPWLTATAFLHSVMIQERRGMLRIWNVSLVLATGVLAILGTFLVRSGVLQSIHAFGASTLGVPFLLLIGVMIAGSIFLVASRSEELRSQNRLDSLLSREAIFMLNNLLLVALCFVIFWGTFFPLIAEAVTGRQRAIGPPVYEQFVVPLALLLVLATGIGPVIAWRRATASNLRRNLGKPALFGVLVVVALIALGVTGSWTALADVRPGGLRRRRHRAGVLARRARAADVVRRGGAARVRVAGGPQPAALRRLLRAPRDHHAVRRRRRLLELQDHPRRGAEPGGEGARRRLRVHLRQADGAAARRAQRAAGADRLRRRAVGAQGRRRAEGAAHLQGLLPLAGPDARPGLALLRRRDDDRGRARREPRQGRLGRGRAGHGQAARPHRRGRPAVRARRRRPDRRPVERVPRARAARADRPLHAEPAARALPARGQPDGDLDLDRRPAGRARRLHRRLAAAPRPLARRERALPRPGRPRGPRARDGGVPV